MNPDSMETRDTIGSDRASNNPGCFNRSGFERRTPERNREMIRLSTLAMAALAFMACNQDESPAHSHQHPNQTESGQLGDLIREFRLSDETTVRFRGMEGSVTLSIEGHQEEQERFKALTAKLLQAQTMEAAYRLMDASGPVPQALLDFDARIASIPDDAGIAGNAAASPAAPGPLSETAEPFGPVTAPVQEALAKSGDHANPASDRTWDWAADARWWNDVVGYPCVEVATATYTNVTWADDWRQGYYATGYLMAASHTYGANAKGYSWKNGAWVMTQYLFLQPRHYIVWRSGDTSKQYRRYAVTGNGANLARVHWGMRWDSQAPSDLGVICQG